MLASPRLHLPLSLLATLALPLAAAGQQPTLRYSPQAARTAQAATAEYQEEVGGPVGTGIPSRVRQAGHQGPTHSDAQLPPGMRPTYQRTASRSAEEIWQPTGTRIVEGPIMDVPMSHGHEVISGDDCASCGHGGPGHGFDRVYCGDPACNTCAPDCCAFCPRPDNIELFVGAHGFTGPLNRGGSGSFGFHEGINGGMPFICGLAIQGGYQATQSNFEGAFFTPDDRTQSFVTVGLFRRVDLGLQGGVVVDYLHDVWDYDAVDLAQLRGELSWRMPCDHEFGFWFATGLDETTVEGRVVEFEDPSIEDPTAAVSNGAFGVEPMDIYAFFYRKQFACGGEGRIFGGFTDDSRGLMGMDVRLPLSQCVYFTTNFLYVVPREESQLGFAEEAWNVSFNFVWTPFARRHPCGPNYCRPLFDVAGNNSFLTRITGVVESVEPQ